MSVINWINNKLGALGRTYFTKGDKTISVQTYGLTGYGRGVRFLKQCATECKTDLRTKSLAVEFKWFFSKDYWFGFDVETHVDDGEVDQYLLSLPLLFDLRVRWENHSRDHDYGTRWAFLVDKELVVWKWNYKEMDQTGSSSISMWDDILNGPCTLTSSEIIKRGYTTFEISNHPKEKNNLHVAVEKSVYTYDRWYKKPLEVYRLEIQYCGDYPPVVFGKGENSWDCDDQVLDNLSVAIETYDENVYLDVAEVHFKNDVLSMRAKRGYNPNHYKQEV